VKEYIERAALIDDFEHCGASKEIVDAIVYRINLHNAADVAEVKHGRWEQHPQSNKVEPVYTCSLCKLNVSGFEKRWIKYCPNCGARMDKEADHGASEP
jgi:hypothetical protein